MIQWLITHHFFNIPDNGERLFNQFSSNAIEDLEPESIGMFYGDPETSLNKRNSASRRSNDEGKRPNNPAYGRDRMNHIVRFFKRARRQQKQKRPHFDQPIWINEWETLEYERKR